MTLAANDWVKTIDGFGSPYLARDHAYRVSAVESNGDMELVTLGGRAGRWPFLEYLFRKLEGREAEEAQERWDEIMSLGLNARAP